MKILKLFTLSAVALLLCTCGSDPVPGPGPEQKTPVEEAAYVKLGSGQSSSVSAGYDRTDIPVSFSTNKNWTAEVSFGASASGWVTLSNRNGTSGSQTLIASVSENNDSAQRSAVITIKAETASVTVTISQEAFKSEFSITPKVIEAAAEGGTVEVSVTSNIGYHASTSVDWIHEMSTKATETKSLWFIVDANESAEPRSGVIVICNDDEVCIPVTVNQAAGEATITISTNLLEFGYDGGESQITVKSNSEWTAECSADWCYVTPSSETGECTVTVKVSGNTEKEARSATVVFKAGENSKTLTISQKPFEAVFDLSPKSHTVDAAGGTVTVTVTSNIGYSFSFSADWIHEEGIAADNDKAHIFRIDENKSTQSRTGAIIFCNDEQVCVPVEITQAGASASISVSPSNLNFTSQGGTESINITSNADWVVSQTPQWCTVSLASGSGDTTADVSVTENGNTYPREGKIVFTAGEATAEVAVKQQAGEPELEVSDTEFLIPGSGDNVSFVIASNADWTVNTGAFWLSASVSSGSGNGQVTLIAEPNPEIKTRTAEVTVKTADGALRKTVTVTQSEGEAFLELDVYTLQFDHLERCSQVKVTSNDSWSAVSSASWCTVQEIASGGFLEVCVKANDTGKSRTAQITVKTKSGGLEKTITVSQSTPEANEGFGDDGEIKWD